MRAATKQLRVGLLVWSIVLFCGEFRQAKAQHAIPAGQVAWHFLNRVLINPTSGEAEVIGYFAFIAGIPGPLFSGSPSEATAFFTFKTSVPSSSVLANGPVSLTLLSPGNTLNVYLNQTPTQNWANPGSFSAGQLIASFKDTQDGILGTGPISLLASGSNLLVSSQDFVFNGQTFNLKRLTPHGVAITVLTNTTPIAGTPDFPVAFAAAGSAVAIGSRLSALGPSAR
jgi:hypothetical protein